MKYLLGMLFFAQNAFANPLDLPALDASEILFLPQHIDILSIGDPASHMPNHSKYRKQLLVAQKYLLATEHVRKVWHKQCPRMKNIATAQIYPPLPEARRIKFRQILCEKMGYYEPFPPKGQADFQPPY